ncbi:MAG: PIN domain-containing protein [Clostridiales bacterium]|nr:PIN domain-containing protein [Clostridiales bacterium]
MNILVDTCVIIDALQKREPFSDDAESICLAVAKGEVNGFVPAKSVADIYYIMHRSLHNDNQTRILLKRLFLSFGILDTTAADCRNAITSPIMDFEDAILAETACRNGVDYIVTRNIRDFSRAKVPVITPHEFLQNKG